MTDNLGLAQRPAHVEASRVFDIDVYRPAGFESDFHGAWKRLHDSDLPELVWTPRNGGHWVAIRGRLIGEMFADYERFSNRVAGVPKEVGELLRFIPNNIEFKRAYAEILPIHIFLNMIDLPLKDAPYLMSIATRVIRPTGVQDVDEAMRAFADYLLPWIEKRRGASGADLMTRMINGCVGSRPVSQQEAIDLCVQVLLGGLDTVLNFLGFAMLFMARSPEHRKVLIAEPALVPAAVDELLRRYPVITMAREVRYDMEYAGVQMKKGEMVALPSPLHGLDEQVNAQPLTVDFARSSSDHSTFGNGPHKCPGMFLAKAELRITLEEWLARIPEFEVKGGVDIEYAGGVVSGLTSLPLVWDVTTTRDLSHTH